VFRLNTQGRRLLFQIFLTIDFTYIKMIVIWLIYCHALKMSIREISSMASYLFPLFVLLLLFTLSYLFIKLFKQNNPKLFGVILGLLHLAFVILLALAIFKDIKQGWVPPYVIFVIDFPISLVYSLLWLLSYFSSGFMLTNYYLSYFIYAIVGSIEYYFIGYFIIVLNNRIKKQK